ncbi:tetratricopeptide repeat protein [Mucilaginibacter segetis]|uniref:Tetratricopeptide repeat protein n=1 Tax=Mucilaginibacter segetis TaxID=2793071 RepID=A0A934PSX5_9SPHI|nr:tetratricopeptide repeat protein [Mucilaginibacter segetis]MBK0379469.1 tetratricopeptide repeat protein [Mucilaginibacter segetis]
MQNRKIGLLILALFTTSIAFGQSEALKSVVNNLAFYKKNNDLKYLSKAKKSADSLIVTHSDSTDMEKNIYRLIVNSSILYTDSLNQLKQPDDFLDKTAKLLDELSERKKAFNYQPELDYSRRSLTNVYIRQGFKYTNSGEFKKAVEAFQSAKKYSPSFKPVNVYIAYANNKLGNLEDAAKYYSNLINTDSTKTEYFETASNIYKSLGDTAKALQIIKKGRSIVPGNKQLLQDEANIYNNKRDYKSLEKLIVPLLDNNPNNAGVSFVAANCYDHLGQYDKAESLYLRAIELDGSAYEPVFNLGLLYFKLSTIKKKDADKYLTSAILWLEKASEMTPNEKNCLELLQLAYAKSGNTNQLERINDKIDNLTH